MAEDKSKKSKIDLKARLGKTSMSGVGGPAVPLPAPGQPGPAPGSDPGSPAAAPVPAASGSGRPPAPVGIAPPPGLSPGIPVPPFAQQKRAEAAPKPSAAQQTIKVEVAEEIHAERRKSKRNMALAAAGTAVLGIVIGYFIGGASSTKERSLQGIKVAQALEKEVKGANDKVKELADKLDDAQKQLDLNKFPTTLVADLGGINIPFDTASNLANKNVGNLPGQLKQLIDYTKLCEDLNKTKDSLRNVLGGAQAEIEKYYVDLKDPVFAYSVVFGPDGSKGIQAELVRNKEPFPASKEWPATYFFLRQERTQQGVKDVEKKAQRWTKGDLTGSDPVVIPVMPSSAPNIGSAKLNAIKKGMYDMAQTIKGDPNDPNAPEGLLAQGDRLVQSLHAAAIKAP